MTTVVVRAVAHPRARARVLASTSASASASATATRAAVKVRRANESDVAAVANILSGAALEMALAHQERLVEELNAVILDQATRVERLERQAKLLATRLVAAEAELPGARSEDRPPPR